MIIFFSDIKQQPGRVLIDIFDFLDLESSFKPEGLKNKDNASKVPRFQKTYAWAKNLVTKLYDWDLVFLIDLAKKFGLKKLFFSGSNNQDFPPLTDELREELGKKGRQRVEEKLEWKHSVPNLLKAFTGP